MKLEPNDKIKIKQILMNNGKPAFVEWFSEVDSRHHIANSETFCDNFGYTLEELALIAFKGMSEPTTAKQSAFFAQKEIK